ncbi:hypothetical protein [Paenibacillus harenae]|uniref:hypothetical protein n=1 Tax=Paenibacillus harenae TaxID=306543 RepID=UPI0012EC4662|nr:hypothetical protein [Paenibacillus harenae]
MNLANKITNRVDVAYSLITNEEQDKVLIVRNIHSSSWSLPGDGFVEIAAEHNH